jgi:purine nucleosidase/pyrimidine-specific ribonucleoside hydrolase
VQYSFATVAEGARRNECGAIAKGAQTPFRALVVSLLQFFAKTYDEVFFMPNPPLHDPCAVLYVADRSLFKAKRCGVHVETANPLSLGQTIVDVLGIQTEKGKENVTVALEMDVEKFWEAMLSAVAVADKRSPLNA